MSSSPSSPVAVLNYHAKSFSWGGFFLGRRQLHNAAVLYSFCRYLDDIADESLDHRAAAEKLAAIDQDLRSLRSQDPTISRFLSAAQEVNIPIAYARDLLAGVKSDLQLKIMRSDSELLTYCYQVAGTVGAMMCAVLDVRDPRALEHAIDMGVAMQLTNICRDVKEDAERGRIYLPLERFHLQGVALEAPLPCSAAPNAVERDKPGKGDHVRSQILPIDSAAQPVGSAAYLTQLQRNSRAVATITQQLLAIADLFYASGREGLKYIPLRGRFAIFVAYHLYKGIGDKQRAQRLHPLSGRISLSPLEKLGRIVGIGLDFIAYSLGARGDAAPGGRLSARAFVPAWDDKCCGRLNLGDPL